MRKYNFVIGLCIILSACKPDLDFKQETYEKKIIVEGYIENGEFPVVYLSSNTPFFQELDSALFFNLGIRYAKVTVSDGYKEEVLTGYYNTDYFPYFMYKGTQMKGEENKTYSLTIEVDNEIITAETTIPPSVPINKIYLTEKSDTTRQINISFTHHKENNHRYKIFTKTHDLNYKFIPDAGIINIWELENGEVEIPVLKGRERLGLDSIHLFFPIDHTVSVKFCTMDSITALYWKSLGNESLSEMNLFTGSATKIYSNVSKPGLGNWGGYGKDTHSIEIK